MPRKQQPANSALVKQPISVVSNTRHTSTPSFGQTMKEGFAFGIGNAVAHSVVRSLFGSSSVAPSVAPEVIKSTDSTVQTARSMGASATQDMSGQIEYLQCMKEGGTEDACKQYLV